MGPILKEKDNRIDNVWKVNSNVVKGMSQCHNVTYNVHIYGWFQFKNFTHKINHAFKIQMTP